MADDQEQRNLEVVKLRIAFLQHMTTLSGAATLIILALLQRIRDPDAVWNLALLSAVLASSTVVSVWGMLLLLYLLGRTDLRLRGSHGLLTTLIAGSLFVAGVVNVAVVAFRFPTLTTRNFFFIVLGAILLIWGIILGIIFLSWKRRSHEPQTNAEDQDPDATPRP